MGNDLYVPACRLQDSRWPGPGRALDAEEEDYFNAEEDEDDYIPPISQQQWVRSLGSGRGSPMPTLKRKRRVSTMGGALGPFQPNLTPRTPSPSLGQLMDYGEDDDDLVTIDAQLLIAPSSEPSANSAVSNGPPPPPKRPADDDDEDNMLEALVRSKSQPRPPTPTPPRSGDKRRRSHADDDEDDEMLERLAKAKKPDFGTQKGAGGGMVTRSAKLGDDPPLKKLKLKFGLGSSVLASSSPTTPSSESDSQNGAKDGDTG